MSTVSASGAESLAVDAWPRCHLTTFQMLEIESYGSRSANKLGPSLRRESRIVCMRDLCATSPNVGSACLTAIFSPTRTLHRFMTLIWLLCIAICTCSSYNTSYDSSADYITERRARFKSQLRPHASPPVHVTKAGIPIPASVCLLQDLVEPSSSAGREGEHPQTLFRRQT